MESNFIATIIRICLLVVLCGFVYGNCKQVDHLEALVIEQTDQIETLNSTLSRLNNLLESGDFRVAIGGGSETPATSGGSADIDYHRSEYEDHEWEALVAEGNYLSPSTFRRNVEGSERGGTIQRAFINDPPGLNPVTENAADVSEMYHYVAETLATRQRDDPDRWIPELAYRIEVNDDYTEYHVYLKEGVLWHEPAVDLNDERYAWLQGEHEVVADDFVFYLELVMNDQVEAAFLRNYYEDCAGIEVINDHEFIVRWNVSTFQSISFTLGLTPLPRWLYSFDEDGIEIPESELGRRFNDHWYTRRQAIGTGPYQFVEWQPNGAITLQRFERYHGEDPPIDRIEFRVMADGTARLNSLRADEVDYIEMLASQYENEILEGGTQQFQTGELLYDDFQGPVYRYLGWNADGEYFGDRRVRLAMTHAFNRQLFLEENMNGLGTIVTGNFYVNGPDYNHDLEPWPFDLDRAAELLDEAGWMDNDGNGVRERVIDGEVVEFEFGMLTYGYRPEFVAAMEAYKNDLERIGIIMNVEPVEWAIMVERMQNKDFDAYTGGWVLGWESDPYQIWHSSQADEPRGSNRVGFRNEEADEIIETARRTFDPEERSALFHRFHEIVWEEQPYTFWFAPLELAAWNSRIQNVNHTPIRPFGSSQNWYIAQ